MQNSRFVQFAQFVNLVHFVQFVVPFASPSPRGGLGWGFPPLLWGGLGWGFPLGRAGVGLPPLGELGGLYSLTFTPAMNVARGMG